MSFYSFITRVVIVVFPQSAQPKLNVISIPRPAIMTHSVFGRGWEEEEGNSVDLPALDASLTGRFSPCGVWMTWQLLPPTLECVCPCLLVAYWCLHSTASRCVFGCQASAPGSRMWVFADVFMDIVLPRSIMFIDNIWLHTPLCMYWISPGACELRPPPSLQLAPSTLPASDDFQKLPLLARPRWHACPLSSRLQRHGNLTGLICCFSHVSLEKQPNIWTGIIFN